MYCICKSASKQILFAYFFSVEIDPISHCGPVFVTLLRRRDICIVYYTDPLQTFMKTGTKPIDLYLRYLGLKTRGILNFLTICMNYTWFNSSKI